MQVCKAANGKEALECLEKMDIDLAILDIMMARYGRHYALHGNPQEK